MRSLVLALAVFVLLLAGLPGPVLADEAAEEADLRARLDRLKLDLSVNDQEFGQVVKQLRAQTGTNILVDPRIQADMEATLISAIQVEDLELARILDLLVTSSGEEVVWVVRGNTIVITHREFAPSQMVARLYPVAALVAGRTGFDADSTLLGIPQESPWEERRYPLGQIDELMELIRGGVEPHYWEEYEGAAVRGLGEHVVMVRAEPRIQQKVHEFLTRLEDMEPLAVTVELRALDAERLPDGLDVGAPALTDAEAETLMASSSGTPALSLAVRKDFPSTAFVGRRRAYVAGYDAVFAGAESLADPKIGTIDEGLAVSVQALPAKPEGRILLKLDAAATRPAPGQEVYGADSGQSIHLPSNAVVRREHVLLLAPGRWHLAEGRLGGADAGRWAFLVRATPAPVERATPPEPTALEIPAVVQMARPRVLDDKRVRGLRWEEADLDHVLQYLRTITGLNFFITPQVREDVFEDVVVNLHLDDVSVRTVLDLVTEPYELVWQAAGNLVTIDVRYPYRREMELRYFDVKDLAEPLQTYAAPPSVNPLYEIEQEEPAPFVQEEVLVELLRETIGTLDVWEDPASIEARNRILIVRQTPAILDTVALFLAALRASRATVALTVDHVELEVSVAERILGCEGVGAVPFLLDSPVSAALEAAIEAREATRLSRERILSVERAGAPRHSGHEISFVSDYDLERSSDGKARAPVARVATLLAGSRIDLRAIRAYAGDRAHLEIRFVRNMLSSKTQAETPYGTIDLPVTDVWSVATGLSVPYKRTVVVCASRAKGVWRLLLATPHYVTRAE